MVVEVMEMGRHKERAKLLVTNVIQQEHVVQRVVAIQIPVMQVPVINVGQFQLAPGIVIPVLLVLVCVEELLLAQALRIPVHQEHVCVVQNQLAVERQTIVAIQIVFVEM